MTSFPPTGIIGACLTPFRPDGTVDADALDREIDFLCAHCDAVSILGAEATEYRLLAPGERRRVLEAGIERAAGRAAVLAGASSDRLSEIVELSETGAAAGAGFAQVLLPCRPWGPEPSTAELVAFVEAVAERSALPVVAYHNPTRGADPSAEALVRIAEIDRVVAFKESSRDMARIGRLVEEIDVAGHARYFTTMQPLLATLAQGGAGAMMPAGATVIGAEVVAAFRAGDGERAARAQRLFATFPSRWRAYGLAPVMKCVMRHLGIDLGDPLPPFAAVSPEDDAAIGAFLAEAGVGAMAAAAAPG